MLPTDINIYYLAYSLIFAGFFLFISGLNIIKIEKITIVAGRKTWIVGITLILFGALIIWLPETPKENKFFYVCYKNKTIQESKPIYNGCFQSEASCISIDKKLIQFGRYISEKDSYMALERCKNNIPR